MPGQAPSPSKESASSETDVAFDAAIFDMDGLLVESESRWRIAEQEAADALGLPLTNVDFDKTMGVRMRQVAETWFQWHPWEGPSPDEVAERVISRVIELCADAEPLAGVTKALELVAGAGLRVALCSSSDERMIDALLDSLGLADRFEVIHSAEHDEHGKPHPQPYLVTAAELGVDPRRCIVFEDSVAGCVSARAAGMTVVAVPDRAERGSGRFGFADLVLDSLESLDGEVLASLAAGVALPSMSRPRFHLAFPVDDLAAARRFYGGVLGCGEGRSAETWVDFDLFGHQIVAHLDGVGAANQGATNDVDGHQVPARHFGLLLHVSAWRELVARLRAAEVSFVIEPNLRFAGEPGEQHTCFVLDPAGNALEFKAFADDRQVFATG